MQSALSIIFFFFQAFHLNASVWILYLVTTYSLVHFRPHYIERFKIIHYAQTSSVKATQSKTLPSSRPTILSSVCRSTVSEDSVPYGCIQAFHMDDDHLNRAGSLTISSVFLNIFPTTAHWAWADKAPPEPHGELGWATSHWLILMQGRCWGTVVWGI